MPRSTWRELFTHRLPATTKHSPQFTIDDVLQSVSGGKQCPLRRATSVESVPASSDATSGPGNITGGWCQTAYRAGPPDCPRFWRAGLQIDLRPVTSRHRSLTTVSDVWGTACGLNARMRVVSSLDTLTIICHLRRQLYIAIAPLAIRHFNEGTHPGLLTI